MEILDYLFEKGKPPLDESEMPGEKTVFDGFDAIRSLLTFQTWKGEPRKLSTMTIAWSIDGWRASLNDLDNGRVTSYTGVDVAGAIEGLDAQLVSKNPRWFYWREQYGSKKNGKPETSSSGSGKKTKSNG